MLFIVATNVVASRPSERRPTGTPHARAKILSINYQVLDISIGCGPYNPRLGDLTWVMPDGAAPLA